MGIALGRARVASVQVPVSIAPSLAAMAYLERCEHFGGDATGVPQCFEAGPRVHEVDAPIRARSLDQNRAIAGYRPEALQRPHDATPRLVSLARRRGARDALVFHLRFAASDLIRLTAASSSAFV